MQRVLSTNDVIGLEVGNRHKVVALPKNNTVRSLVALHPRGGIDTNLLEIIT